MLTQLNSGVNKFTNSTINTNEIFATTTPPKKDLVQTNGVWNLEKAVGGSYKILFEVPTDPILKEELDLFENLLYDEINAQNFSHIKVNFFAQSIFLAAFSSVIEGDLLYVIMATNILIV